MSTEQNKKNIQRLFNEGMNEKKFQILDELISEKYVNHGIPNAPQGVKGFKAIIELFTNAFPDMKINVQEIIADGDSVATRGYFTGTHKGDFNGIGATGKKVRVDYIDFWKMSSGKAVENWVQMDNVGLMQQIGATQQAF
jgi:predicted ester cyclase